MSCISMVFLCFWCRQSHSLVTYFRSWSMSCCVGAAVLQPGVTFTLISTLLLPFISFLANYLINCTSCSFSSVFVLSIPGLFFTLMEITSWNSLLSNVWLRLAGLVFLSVFFFSSWPSCHLLLLSDIILGSEPCAKSSDELEIGSGPCLVTLSLTSETQSSKHAPVFPHFLSLVMMGEQKKCLWSQGDNEGSGPK